MSSIVKKNFALEETLLEVLTCPVCLTCAEPPLQMCINSHITCNECFERLRSCPTCRGAKGTGRAFILEKIYERIEIPCKYDGCTFKGKGKIFKEHKQSCNFLPIVCPVKYEFRCTWNGTIHLLPEHLKNAHPQNVFFATSQNLRVKEFIHKDDLHLYLLFCVYGKVFMLSWLYAKNLQSADRFTMSEIGNPNPETPERFQFALYFSSDLDAAENDTNCVHMSAGITREDMSREEGRFHYGNFFTLRHAWLLDVCDQNGDLNYKVVIRKIKKPSENDTYCKIWKKGKE